MTDDERLQRLTEMARRVWPYCTELEIVSGPRGLLVAGNDPHVAPDAPRTTQLCINHYDSPVPLLDALEAALLVLSEEVTLREIERAGLPQSGPWPQLREAEAERAPCPAPGHRPG